MGRTVVRNPKTGQLETVNDYRPVVTPEQVAETRRKLRDMLSGNIQFHTDDWEKKEEKVVDSDEQTSDTDGFYGGFFP